MKKSLSDSEMMNLLVELSKTKFWDAIQKYNRQKDNLILTSLGSMDPFKDPSSMARSQGMRLGIYSMEQEVNEEALRRQKVESGEPEEDDADVPKY